MLIYEGTPESLLPCPVSITLTELILDSNPELKAAERGIGVKEDKITGLSAFDRFSALAEAFPRLNPYERKKIKKMLSYFGETGTFSKRTAPVIWKRTSEKLFAFDPTPLTEAFGKQNISVLTDIASSPSLPGGFRPAICLDRALAFGERGISEEIRTLGNPETFADYLKALSGKISLFAENGAGITVLHFGSVPFSLRSTEEQRNEWFRTSAKRDGRRLNDGEIDALQTSAMLSLLPELRGKNMKLAFYFGEVEKGDILLPTPYGKIYELFSHLAEQSTLPETVLFAEGEAKRVASALTGAFPSIIEGHPAVSLSPLPRMRMKSPLLFTYCTL